MSFLFKNHLYCITSRQHTDNIAEQVLAMLKGGAKIIQYRDKEASDSEFAKTARELLNLTRQFEEVIFLVNDRVEIAAKVGADGVHVGWEDVERFGGVEKVRRYFKDRDFDRPPPSPPDYRGGDSALQCCIDLDQRRFYPIVGVSTHSLEQALVAEKMGADYIGIGPVFVTPTKPDYKPIGLDVVRKVARVIKIPVVAIGGIDASNFQKVLDLGVEAVAMVRGVCCPMAKDRGELSQVESIVRRLLSL